MKRDWKRYSYDEYAYIGKQTVAGRRIRQAVQNGTIKPANRCELCEKEENLVAHHWRGYDYPFSVWWVCYECNANLPHHDGAISKEQAKINIEERYSNKTKEKYYRSEHQCWVCGLWTSVGKYVMAGKPWENYEFICSYCGRDIFDD